MFIANELLVEISILPQPKSRWTEYARVYECGVPTARSLAWINLFLPI